MDIISPKTIWRDYDRETPELSVNIISDIDDGKERIIRAYFNGGSAPAGVVRIFVKLAIPSGGIKVPLVALQRDADRPVDGVETALFTSRGYGVVVSDYAGNQDWPFHTVYPRSMDYAVYKDECLSRLPGDPRKNCWIVWTEVLLRSITFGCTFDFIDKTKIAVIGDGVASASVWKACTVDGSITAGVSMFSSRFRPKEERGGEESAYLGYEASLMDASYAPHIRLPLLVIAASNESDDSIDDISEAYALIPKETGCRFSISERMNHRIGYKQNGNIWLWLDYSLRGAGTLPAEPALTASCSEGKLYYGINGVCGLELFVSQSALRGSLRNWHSEELVQTGNNEYISRHEIYDINKPVYAFANAAANGFSFSTPLLAKLPSAMGVKAVPIKTSRFVYDSELGLDDWTVMSDNPCAHAKMVTGPFGLEGVSADAGSLMTYKLAEPKYAGDENSILQITLWSKEPQNITFVITALRRGGEASVELYANETAAPGDNWRKYNFEPGDFKSEKGGAADWSNIISIRIDSENPIVIKSILWV